MALPLWPVSSGCSRIVDPADRGITGFATWSLAKLADRHVVPRISRETPQRILREGEVSW